jgi:hypothetical protein
VSVARKSLSLLVTTETVLRVEVSPTVETWRHSQANVDATMPDTDFYWLVGLLEGEGSFIAATQTHQEMIRVEMTDADVVQRVATLFGVR